MEATRAQPAWGVDSEYGLLLDALLCRPDNFRWLPTSAISRATLERGGTFDRAEARRQHDEMVAAYEDAGVSCHFLEPDPALPYQVFARDSSVVTPEGAIVTQLHQWWRRGEYAPVIRFCQERGIPIRGMVTAAALEGGDFLVVEPGTALIGNGEERTQEPAARQVAGWLEADGWEVRIEPIPARYVHMDVLVCMLAERLGDVCVDAAPAGLVDWLRAESVGIVPVSVHDALRLGVSAVAAGRDLVRSRAGS